MFYDSGNDGFVLGAPASRGDACSHVIEEFGELQIAEDAVAGTPLVGQTLLGTKWREQVGVSVVGIWERGTFTAAQHTPES
jgi:voltage-gated potassium channel